MSGVTVEMPAADRFAASLGDAADQLGDLDALDRDLAGDVLGVARIPVRTGALKRSAHAEPDSLGFTLAAGGPAAPYGPIVHARNPFFTRALQAQQGHIRDAYTGHVTDALNTIQGD